MCAEVICGGGDLLHLWPAPPKGNGKVSVLSHSSLGPRPWQGVWGPACLGQPPAVGEDARRPCVCRQQPVSGHTHGPPWQADGRGTCFCAVLWGSWPSLTPELHKREHVPRTWGMAVPASWGRLGRSGPARPVRVAVSVLCCGENHAEEVERSCCPKSPASASFPACESHACHGHRPSLQTPRPAPQPLGGHQPRQQRSQAVERRRLRAWAWACCLVLTAHGPCVRLWVSHSSGHFLGGPGAGGAEVAAMGTGLGPPVAAGGSRDSSDAWGRRGVCPALREEGLGPGRVPWAPVGASLWLQCLLWDREEALRTQGGKRLGPSPPSARLALVGWFRDLNRRGWSRLGL